MDQAVDSASAVALLATTAGIAGVVVVIMNALRAAVKADWFDRWAPLLSMLIGVALAVAFAVVTVNPLTGTAVLGAVVVGLMGGALSQNANTVIQRTFNPPPPHG